MELEAILGFWVKAVDDVSDVGIGKCVIRSVELKKKIEECKWFNLSERLQIREKLAEGGELRF